MSEPKKNPETNLWEVDFRLNGRHSPRVQRTGKKGFETKDAALEFIEEQCVDFRRGQLKQKTKDFTLREIADLYIREHVEKNNLSPETQTANVDRVTADWGTQSIKAITTPAVILWLNRLQDAGLKGSTRKRYLGTLCSIFNWAILMEYTTTNPCERVTTPAVEEPYKRILELDELKRLIAVAGPRLRKYMFVAFKTGARPKQIKALLRKDVDITRGIITFRKAKRINNTYKVFMDDELKLFFVRESMGKSPDDKMIDFTNHVRDTREAIKHSKINEGRPADEHFTMYGLKHTFATHAIEAGASTLEVSKLFGHRDDKMVIRHYADVLEKRRASTPARVSWDKLTPHEKVTTPVPPKPRLELMLDYSLN